MCQFYIFIGLNVFYILIFCHFCPYLVMQKHALVFVGEGERHIKVPCTFSPFIALSYLNLWSTIVKFLPWENHCHFWSGLVSYCAMKFQTESVIRKALLQHFVKAQDLYFCQCKQFTLFLHMNWS
jgi:hypothetical protein